MSLKRVLRNVLDFIFINLTNKYPKFKYFLLKIKTYFFSYGIYIPWINSSTCSQVRWATQEIVKTSPNPHTYIKEDNSITELFKDVLPSLDKNSSILEIGCNVGRSLNYLYCHGYKNLTGIEIGAKAVELMKTIFPDMYNDSKVMIGDAPTIIKTLKTDQYDLVFCHSVLVNIHPKYNYIFREMARVSRKFILILENEGSYSLYPRDFVKMFERHNYKMIMCKVFPPLCKVFPMPFQVKDLYKNNTIRLFVKDDSKLF